MIIRLLRTANFKLALLYAAIFSISVFLLGGIVFFSVQQSLEKQLRARIESETTQLLGDYQDDGLDELRHDIQERIEASPAHRLFYSLKHQDGRIIFDKIDAPTSPGWHKSTTLKEEKLLLLYTELKEGYALMVAADLDGVTEMKHAVRNSFLLTSFFTLLLSIAGGVMVSNRFLTRVDQLKQTASNIGRGNLSERIPLAGTGDDFDQLTLTINQMLDRMELLMGDVRNVSTSIAHDLRTPLAKLRQKLEHLQQLHEEPDTSYKLCTEAIALLDETLETFSALLRIAEIESGGSRANFTTFDFSALLSHLAETYAPVVEDHAQTLSTHILPDIHIKGDKSLLTQLFANLIENAYKHAGTGAAIQLLLSQEKGHIIAVVSDNGAGIPTGAYEHITKPFYRLDRSRHTKGSGLGLSMVAAIVSLHGAKLVLDDNQPGLKVEIMFTE